VDYVADFARRGLKRKDWICLASCLTNRFLQPSLDLITRTQGRMLTNRRRCTFRPRCRRRAMSAHNAMKFFKRACCSSRPATGGYFARRVRGHRSGSSETMAASSDGRIGARPKHPPNHPHPAVPCCSRRRQLSGRIQSPRLIVKTRPATRKKFPSSATCRRKCERKKNPASIVISLPINPNLKNLPTYQPDARLKEVARELGLPAKQNHQSRVERNPFGPSPLAIAAMQKSWLV